MIAHLLNSPNSQNPMLLDSAQNRDELIKELDRLQEIVTEQQSRYQTYKGYEKSFKVTQALF